MLSGDQITQFNRLGFLDVPNVLTPEETAYFTRVFDETMRRLEGSGYFDEVEVRGFSNVTRGYRRQVVPLFEKDDRFLELLDHSRLNDLVEQLLGEDCMLIEPGVGAIFSGDSTWHCDVDGPYDWTWIKCNLYLDEPTTETGSFYFIPGSHLREFGDPVEDALIAGQLGGVATAEIPGAYPVVPRPGSVVVFNQLTRHAYFDGKTLRRTILINYTQSPRKRWHEYQLTGRIKYFSGHWGEPMFYDRLLESASPRRLKRIKTPMEMAR